MISGITIRTKRVSAGIAGQILCKKLGFSRSRLTAIEKEYWKLSMEELQQIDAALDELIQTKARMEAVGTKYGWPGLAAVRSKS